MLLVMDIGNTNIKLAVYDGDKNLGSWRVAVIEKSTADEYGITIKNLFSLVGISFDDIDGAIISSVVPSMNYTIEHMCQYYINVNPIFVSHDLDLGMEILYDNPRQLGSDRLVNSIAAATLYGVPCIVLDVGTATTFSVVDKNGAFAGGVIAPGLKSSINALSESASKLPFIEIQTPKKVIGTSTVENMQAGAVYGFIGLIDNIINMIRNELCDDSVKIIATGGLFEVIKDKYSKEIFTVDRSLTLKGLKIIYDRQKSIKEV